MKIYDKKAFLYGAGYLLLAGGLLLTAKRPIGGKPLVLAVLCAAVGLGLLLGSFSRRLARESRLEERDERNRLIALKAGRKTSQITQAGSALVMIAFLGIGKGTGNREFLAIGLGAAFCFAISLFAEMFAKFYFEKHS